MSRGGRPSKIGDKEKDILRQIVEDSPLATLEEVTAAFRERTGLSVHSATVRKGLREAGIERRRARIVPSDPADEPPQRYGYQAHHRDQMSEQRYPSCLTDAEWALVSDLFDNEGGRGVPPRYSRRTLVDACCYVVRTGCACSDYVHVDDTGARHQGRNGFCTHIGNELLTFFASNIRVATTLIDVVRNFQPKLVGLFSLE